MINSEAKTSLCSKLNTDYSIVHSGQDDLFSDADIQEYIDDATLQAWGFKKWDFTEAAKTGTLTGTHITKGYVDYPIDLESGSADMIVVNGNIFRLQDKLNYRSYIQFLSDNPTSTDRVWCEYKRFIFINMNSVAEGQTYDVYGKLRCPKLSAENTLLPFSTDSDDQEDSGNRAIVILAYARALSSDKKKNPAQGELEEKRAFAILERLWKPTAQQHANEQFKGRQVMNVPDFFAGANSSKNIGNFNL